MSSTERAPEPTMEEILASIRRIISDDEANSTQQRATSSEYAEQVRVEDADYEAADTQMIADIERALGSVRGAAEPAPVDDDLDDILDLTEPGGTSPEDVMMADEPITVLEEIVLETDITEVYEEPQPKLDFSAAFPPSEPLAEMAESLSEAVESFAESAPAYEQPEPAYEEPAPTYDEPVATFVEETVTIAEMPASEPPVAAQPMPSLDDPTTALERAIAALKAGDLAAFAREAQAGSEAPDPVYVPPASIYAMPEPAPSASEPAIEPDVPSFEPEPEPEIVVMDEEEAIVLAEPETTFEPSAPSWQAESPSWSDVANAAEPELEPESAPEFEPEPEPAPWHNEGMSWRGAPPANEFELNPARVNGGRDHEPHDYAGPGSSKTLEDSVKEMLRPMLKQWLDENMQRVLTAALREELENSDMRRGS
jgi:cell pole-organizing protein PopZ